MSVFFFFKQKTAYEMRISDWSSDVCSSDLAMGHKGTEAAKEAAEMVLLDDNFASIVAAVREGRTVYDNIRKVIAWTLPTNGGEAVAVVLAILIGFTLPMTATQRSEEHTSELQSLMRISYAVFCLKKKTHKTDNLSRPTS